MSNKAERYNRAEYLLRRHPQWTRVQLQAQLRYELGQGIRYSEFGRMQVRARKVVRVRKEREVTLRQIRKRNLLAAGFLPFEVNVLAKGTRGKYSLSRPYTQRMVEVRRRLLVEFEDKGWGRAKYRREIGRIYRTNGWLVPESSMERIPGDPDPWAMWRHFYNLSVASGEYSPPYTAYDPNKPHKTKEQARQQRQRQKERRSSRTDRGPLYEKYDSSGQVVGFVVWNPETGKFEQQ